jgi:SagB-type dehydrogenase family enzyme
VRAKAIKRSRGAAPAVLSVRLPGHVALTLDPAGKVVVAIEGQAFALGTIGPGAAERVRALRTGLPLADFASRRRAGDKEVEHLVRRLARFGLVEYALRRPRGGEQVVIEPQLPDYWPHAPSLRDGDTLALSRFAYLRQRAGEMVLESPRAGALFRLRDPRIATLLATLATPQPVKRLRREPGFPGAELLALLVDCGMLFKPGAVGEQGLRAAEGDENLVVWDFHDLLFHARSTEGRHANPTGATYPHAETLAELPMVRLAWPGAKIDLGTLSSAAPISPAAQLLRDRHSVRDFDEALPITLAELARFLDRTARIQSTMTMPSADGGPPLTHTVRPYPSGGANYELELYLAVDRCDGLARGFYHYDAQAHALVAIEADAPRLDALLAGATLAMGASAAPQILITMAARFGRVSWKYSAIAYALILKDVGVLLQTFYLMATDMDLAGCAIGSTNIDLFAQMTGIAFHVEGAVGQFALGRGAPATRSPDGGAPAP